MNRAMVHAVAAALAAAPLIFIAGCATAPADDPVLQGKLTDLDGRIARIERVISNQSLLDMSQRIESLQSQVREQRGRIDELENMNEALQKQQRALYSDLDKRVAQLSPGGGGAGAGVGAGATGSGVPQASAPGSEQASYLQALDQLKSGKYPDAIASLQQFLSTYPKSDLADNAEYWLGEAYYVTRDFPKAATAFKSVLDQWPNSRKAPDALLKLGYTQFELKQYADARATLTDVTKRFPGSNDAELASERLRQMQQGGSGGRGGAGAAGPGAGAGTD
ncbi:MAG TPA: tol-pal system protein YbgF [Steroidobacteraceae bacterium]|nr:tol-pal system protein YbgF [Steroidobacteraceae bacterium]